MSQSLSQRRPGLGKSVAATETLRRRMATSRRSSSGFSARWRSGSADAAVAIGGPKQRALLALLLLSANRVVSRERLIGELFAEQSVNSADHALRNHVSRLRKVLGAAAPDEPRLVARAPGYLLRVEPGRARPRALRASRRPTAARRWPRGDAAACGRVVPRRGGAVARAAARRSRVRAVRAGRGRAARGAAARGGRGANRCGARARPAARARSGARGAGARASLPRALPRAADARALPVGSSGGGARGLSADAHAPERRARARAGRRAAGARAGDPRAGPRARRSTLERRRRCWPHPLRDVCPFKGLAPFEAADAEFFFGRERLVDELVGRLAGRAAARARRAVRERQVVAPPRRPAAGARRASTRSSGRGDPLPSSRLGRRASGSSRSTSSRSCSRRRSARTSGARSSTRSSRPPGIRSAARSSCSRCARTSSAISRRTSSSPISSGRTTSCSGR